MGPAVAGMWYPEEPAALARMVDVYLEPDRPAAGAAGRLLALIGPHAGFVYSGAVAGHAFRQVREQAVRRVIVLGPSHHASFRGAALPDANVYRTPLGDVALDCEAMEALALSERVRVTSEPFAREHSLEAELPFLQRALGDGWTAVPMLIGPGSWGPVAQEIADALKPWIDERTLIVVSSDFTHYGTGFGYVPFYDDVEQRIRELDMGAVDLIRGVDVDGFESYLARTGATICGRDAIDVLLRLLPEGSRADLAAYDASGRMTGDWDHTVSYAAIVFREG